MKTEFLTPVGRLVQGDPFEAQTKNMQGQPLMTQSGQPTQRFFIAVAFKKDDPAFGPFWQKIEASGKAGFPALNPLPFWDQNCRFSWKVMDGDGVDDNGKSNAQKEGFAGCWVVKFSSSFAPRCFHANRYAPHEQIQDPKTIRRGYYVRVAGSIEPNANPQKPGVYVNLSMVELAGQGPEITSGPDAGAVFGAVAGVLPPGATPLPMHAAGAPALPQGLPGALPGMPVAALPAGAPPLNFAALAPPAMALPTPMAVQPNPAFLAPGPAPVGMPQPFVPPQPAAPQMTAKAGGFTYEQYRSQGWTDEALRTNGMMV